ncbi:MAG: DNA methyltransferase [Acidobacteriota bacterium]
MPRKPKAARPEPQAASHKPSGPTITTTHEIKQMQLTKIIPADYNPREITPEARAGLQASLERFGLLDVLVVNKRTGRLVKGHQRLELLLASGVKRAPVLLVDFDEITEKAANVSLNNQQITGMFTDALLPLIDQIKQAMPDDVLALRMNELRAEIAENATDEAAEGKTDPDSVPAIPETAITVEGDIWLLDQHRILCGDSTRQDMIDRLFDGAHADLAVTSPPYNVGMKYASYKDNAKRDEYLQIIRDVAGGIYAVLNAGRFIAWNIGVSPDTFPHHQVVVLEDVGFFFYRQIVWAKSGVPYPIFPSTMRTKRARHYKPNYTHELIEILEKGEGQSGQVICPCCDGVGTIEQIEIPSASAYEAVQLMINEQKPELGQTNRPNPRYQNDIWRINQSMATRDLKTTGTRSSGLLKEGKRSHMTKEHPAAYPAELPRAVMIFLTAKGEIVYDPFLGSGTTLIAAEQLGRRAYGIEIEPRYVDVCVRRWEEFTGKKAKKANEKCKMKNAKTDGC